MECAGLVTVADRLYRPRSPALSGQLEVASDRARRARGALTDFADLPSEIPMAEGLTFVGPGLLLVGSDEPGESGDNLFTVRLPDTR